MAPREQSLPADEFEHESLQDAASIAEYLRAVIAGLEAGELELGDDHGELLLRPRGLLGLEVRARRRGGRVKLRVKISWTEEEAAAVAAGGLRVLGARK